MYSFTGQGIISQKLNNASKNASSNRTLKTVDLGLVLIALSWSCGQILVQSLTTHERQFLQGNLFLLAVCTHEVLLYLCSIFGSRSQVQFSTPSYCVWSMERAPNCIS